jgi:hypothetical protein
VPQARYKSATQALRIFIEARLRNEEPPSSTGAQLDRLIAGKADNPLPAEVLRHCALCGNWTVYAECPDCCAVTFIDPAGGMGSRAPKQSRTARPDIPAGLDPLGDMSGAWDAMRLDDQFVLQLWIVVPPWLDRARSCRRCGHVWLGDLTADGMVWGACQNCQSRNSRRIRGKATTIAQALTTFRRRAYRRAERKHARGEVPLWRLLKMRHYKGSVDKRAVGGIVRGALDRWEKELKTRGLV